MHSCGDELELALLMSAQAVNPAPIDLIMERLEDQIAWYDRKSLANQRTYKRLKVVEITFAAAIPLLSALTIPHLGYVAGMLGVIITVLEGLLHLPVTNIWRPKDIRARRA